MNTHTIQKHPDVVTMWSIWQRLGHCYEGDGGFRDGTYLVAHPREWIDRIARLATDRRVEAPFSGERTVTLGLTHSIAGNPDRMQTGLVELREDARWKTAMCARSNAQTLRARSLTVPSAPVQRPQMRTSEVHASAAKTDSTAPATSTATTA